MEQLEFTATADEAGVRIDRCLSDKYEELSRSYLQKLLKDQSGAGGNDKAEVGAYRGRRTGAQHKDRYCYVGGRGLHH